MTHGVPVRIGLVGFDPAEGVETGQNFDVTIEMDGPIEQIDGQEIEVAYSGPAAAGLKSPAFKHIEAGQDTLTYALSCSTAGDLTVTATAQLPGGPQTETSTITIG